MNQNQKFEDLATKISYISSKIRKILKYNSKVTMHLILFYFFILLFYAN